MALKTGIVGLPNVGKSTLFNALTNIGAETENYPFCTIDPNVGVVEVPDPRLEAVGDIVQPEELIPAYIEFVDIAGLVKGASRGEGLGNQFLAHIREVDAISHVVRCFDDENVAHVEGLVDPRADIETVESELLLADLETVEKRLETARRNARSGDREKITELELLEDLSAHIEQGRPVLEWSERGEFRDVLKELHLLTDKPVIYAANIAEDDLQNGPSPALEAVHRHARQRGAEVVEISAKLEAELAGLEAEDRVEFLDALGLSVPGLERLIRAAHRLLDLVTFFTTQSNEVRAWTVTSGTTAPAAGGRIHSDFEEGFIRAEVINWNQLVEAGGYGEARDRGLVRVEGRDYVVTDGDVIRFHFND